MKYLKKFENFSNNYEEVNDIDDNINNELENEDEFENEDESEDEDENDLNTKTWGDESEIVESLTDKQKKLPKHMQDFILKKQNKNDKCKCDGKCKNDKCKCDGKCKNDKCKCEK